MTTAESIPSFCLTKALLRQPTTHTPIWMMRQAGRYLPEYREVRAKAGSFMALCQNSELAAEVTLQPLRRYDLDAAIVFADILTIPDAMGLGLHFIEGKGPQFSNPLSDQKSIAQLPTIDAEQDLGYVMQTIRLCKQQLPTHIPLIGFSGCPWTIACYMLENGSSQRFAHIKTLMYDEPATLHLLLQKLTTAISDYLNAQIAAGADTVMLFDSWAGVLGTTQFAQFSQQYIQQIIGNIRNFCQQRQRNIPIIVFAKGGGLWLETLAQTGCDALSLDWTVDMTAAFERVGSKVALQGNLDPAVLLAKPEIIVRETTALLDGVAHQTGFVFNLGHGITPDVPPDHVATLVETVKKYHKPD